MIDLNATKQQAETVKKLLKEVNKQNRIFENIIDSALKGAPESDKSEINKIRILSQQAVNLAKQGKLDDAQNLIKNFKSHGNQNS